MLVTLVAAALGFGLWFTVFAAIAATVSDPTTSSRGQLVFLPALALAVGFLGNAGNVDGALFRFFALFPFTSPSALPVRMMSTEPYTESEPRARARDGDATLGQASEKRVIGHDGPRLMATASTDPSYPWPSTARRWLWSFLGATGVALVVAFVPSIGARVGIAFSQDAVDGWPMLFVPLGVMFLGGAFGVLASGIVVVNRGRDGRTRRYLLPSRAGVIETPSRPLLVAFVAATTVFALVLGGMGAVLVLRALA